MKTMKQKLTSKWSLKHPLYLNKKDSRYKKHLKQLKDQGFIDSETWSLYGVIAEFILPRLKRFREIIPNYPMGETENSWKEKIDRMIFAFDWILNGESECCRRFVGDEFAKEIDIGEKKCSEGLKLFAEWFQGLWW